MGLIAIIYFILYSVFGFSIISIAYILFCWLFHFSSRPWVTAMVLTALHFLGYCIYLLTEGESMTYEGASLVFPFLLFSFIIGGIPVYVCFYGICKAVTRRTSQRPL